MGEGSQRYGEQQIIRVQRGQFRRGLGVYSYIPRFPLKRLNVSYVWESTAGQCGWVSIEDDDNFKWLPLHKGSRHAVCCNKP